LYILVAEDDWAIAQDIEHLLQGAGYRVAVVADAVGAMRALADERPAVATVDLNLRDGLSGADIARALVHAGVPTIICSGDPGARKLVGDTSIFGLIQKPFDSSALLRAVADAFNVEERNRDDSLGRG
jgi:DNA-binding NtrC family response regulator